jgi:TonB family protein
MLSERLFQITLVISFITHGVILLQNQNLSILPANRNLQNLEVSYVMPQKELEKSQKITQGAARKEPFLKLPEKITVNNRVPPPFIDKDSIFRNDNPALHPDFSLAKPAFPKPDILAIKKKITLPEIDMQKIDNPSYISYYQIVREKIKRAAYQNYTGKEIGEVTLSFIISSDGHLKDLHLIEEKSNPSAYLREIALRSVKDASNFPAFPKELDYPQLSFNLAITFEIE